MRRLSASLLARPIALAAVMLAAVMLAAVMLATVMLAAVTLAGPASAETTSCKPEDIAAAVDQTGATLRKMTMETAPQLQPRLKALAAKKGWGEEGFEEAAFQHLRDAKIAKLDETASELLQRIDTLGEVKPGEPLECSRLDGIKAAGVELLAVMKAKTAHLKTRIDAELGPAAGGGAPTVAVGTPPSLPSPPTGPTPGREAAAPDKAAPDKPAADKPTPDKPTVIAKVAPSSPPPQAGAPAAGARPGPGGGTSAPSAATSGSGGPAPAPAAAGSGWTAKTSPTAGSGAGSAAPPPPAWPAPATTTARSRTGETAVAVLPPPAPSLPAGSVEVVPGPSGPPPGADGAPRPSTGLTQPPTLSGEDGYTVEEIRDATRGFFGSVSTGLAAVIEHAFRRSGRPTGYVLGTEGGAAFIGGLRYGKGILYTRAGQSQEVYWHGPSLGFDFGAAGTRVMFLAYRLREADDIHRVFTGIDGSAFVVGGVGLTLLAGGNMILAPIRSGIGVRIGANIGYVRFTPQRTWNPF